MQPIITRKSGFLALIIAAIAFTSGLLTACNISSNKNPASSANVTDASAGHHGAHGDMNHSMAMDLGTADGNYDLQFIDGMRLHHRGAIAMAEEAQQKSQRPQIKKLARNIIETQSKEENEQLSQWRQKWYPQASKEPVVYDAQSKSLMPMSPAQQQTMAMVQDLGNADPQFDLRFMNAMIAHHEGAIAMAQDAMKKSMRPEIKQLAQDITTSQQAEIDQMKRWRQAWYKK